MKLLDICDFLDTDLEIIYSQRCKRFWAHLKEVEIKESVVLGGYTIEESLRHYVNLIRGKRLVYKATDKEKRVEFSVPQDLEIGDFIK